VISLRRTKQSVTSKVSLKIGQYLMKLRPVA